MNWKVKFLLLLALSFPALTGYPLTRFETQLVPGASYGWIVYFALSGLVARLLTGAAVFSVALSIATVICLPVVFMGGAVSGLLLLLTGEGTQAEYSAHYLSLCLTMLTVIPLALSMAAVVPFAALEQAMLQGTNGVSRWEKIGLMFLRVFTHILCVVIPNILEVLREEGLFPGQRDGIKGPLRQRTAALTEAMIHVGVEAICSAIRFIPLWAEEIARLPGKEHPIESVPKKRADFPQTAVGAGRAAGKQEEPSGGSIHARQI